MNTPSTLPRRAVIREVGLRDGLQAIARTLTAVADQDVVLLAGKGHEATQEVAGSKLPFSDRAHAEQALQARHSGGVRP